MKQRAFFTLFALVHIETSGTSRWGFSRWGFSRKAAGGRGWVDVEAVAAGVEVSHGEQDKQLGSI